MDLKDLLKKTQTKQLKIVENTLPRKPPSIAISDRPYENINEKNLSQTKAKHKSNLSQTKDKLEPKPKPNLSQSYVAETFLSLVGLQRKILLMVFSECKTLRSRTTTPLTIENIAAYCDTTKSAGRKAIQRLEEKGLLLRTCFKAGPGGWTQ